MVTADPVFAHPRLARVYDAFDGPRDDLDAYEALVVEDDDWTAALRGVRAALGAGGQLVFETRRPSARAWETWGAGEVVVRDVPGVGRVEQRQELTRVELLRVSFRYDYLFEDGTNLSSHSTLRFRDREQVTADLRATGFAVREVRDAPDRPGLEWVFLADAT